MRPLKSLTAGLASAKHAVVPLLSALWRRARQRPLRALVILCFALALLALALFNIAEYSGLGRWWWN